MSFNSEHLSKIDKKFFLSTKKHCAKNRFSSFFGYTCIPFTCEPNFPIMKKMLLSAGFLALACFAQASNPQLIVQRIDNHGLVNGQTYRLYCTLEQGSSVQVVFGDESHPLSIRTEGALFQHDFGGHTSASINEALSQSTPALKYDSWLTLGFENSYNNELWELGMDYAGFVSDNQMIVDNGGWFLVPTSSKCQPNAEGLILLGQFTTSGVVSGTLNIKGKDAAKQTWIANDLSFSTTQAIDFGCNDKAATNYAPEAAYHDAASCSYKNGQSPVSGSIQSALISDWSVFPNPLRGDQINIQLTESMDVAAVKPTLQIVDQSGKIVFKMDVQPSDVSNNRLTVQQSLSAGTYQIIWTQAAASSSKTLVVQK